MKVAHHPACGCGGCRIRRLMSTDESFREEVAGRLSALTEARPSHWAPRPGTQKAIERRYGAERKSA